MLIRILISLITLLLATPVFAVRSVQFDVGKESYHLGFFGTYFQGEYGALALSPDIIFKPEGDSIFAPAAYWYLQPEHAFFQELSLGIRGYFSEYEHHDEREDVEAAAFSLMARSRVLSLNWPFYIIGSINYAPQEMSFGDAQSLFAYSLNLEYELLQQFFVYAGYRNIMIEKKTGRDDVRLDDTPYLGMRFAF